MRSLKNFNISKEEHIIYVYMEFFTVPNKNGTIKTQSVIILYYVFYIFATSVDSM